MKLCETCKRKPSERMRTVTSAYLRAFGYPDPCKDPIHDLADAAPEMFEALEAARKHISWDIDTLRLVDAALGKAVKS